MKSTPFTHRPPREWLKITLQVPKKQADLAAGFLMELTSSGIEQQQGETDTPLETETIIGYLEKNAQFLKKKEELETFFKQMADDLPDPSAFKLGCEEILEEDWNRKWKDIYKPLKLTETITIKPTWESYTPEQNEIVIEIDPGMAFGTGLHESTQLALQLIEQCFRDLSAVKLQKALDVGTGTGILAMACAFLGSDNVLAIDNDPDAVAAALDNVKHNHLSNSVTVTDTDIGKTSGNFNLISANITSDVLSQMSGQFENLLAPEGRLILAGILKGEQAENITSLFCGLGLTLLSSPGLNEWQAFMFSKNQAI